MKLSATQKTGKRFLKEEFFLSIVSMAMSFMGFDLV
jgi:hypothetical protein